MNGELLAPATGGLLERLLLVSIDVALFGAIAWLGLRFFRRCPPRLAAVVWLLVLAKSLVTLAAGPAASLVWIPLPWATGNSSQAVLASAPSPVVAPAPTPALQPESQSGPTPTPTDVVRTGSADHAIEKSAEPSAYPPVPEASQIGPCESSVETKQTTSAALLSNGGAATTDAKPSIESGASSRPIARGMDWVLNSVALLWVGGLIWGVGAAVGRLTVLRRRIAACRVANGALDEMYQSVIRELRYRGCPARLLVGDSLKSPALIGCLRPVIVLPQWFVEQGDAARIRWALKHEVTHLLHRDHWSDHFRRAARALLFFHPMVRLAARRWEESAEEACDRALVRKEKDVVDYTACLVSIVEQVGHGPRGAAALELFVTQTQIRRRIGKLLALKSADLEPAGRRHRWLPLALIPLMLCGFSLARQPRDEPDKPPARSVLETLAEAVAENVEASPSEPVKSRLDSDTAQTLAAVLEANRYWFESPPQGTPGYRYTFVHRNSKRQEFTVADPHTAGAWTRRGITYEPLVAVLLRSLVDPESKASTLDGCERTDGEIRVTFQTDGSLGSRLGGGVSGSWAGYIYYKLGNGTLRLDAKTLLPIELVSTLHDDGRNEKTTVTERFAEPAQMEQGHWVPLRVEAVRDEKEIKEGQVVSEKTYRFDWAFRVHQPGVWLFDAELAAQGTALGYHLEDVQIGDTEKPVAQASSSTVAAIRASQERARKIVDQYVDANRAWLLPDLDRRKGLVYDYLQEDGYREQVIFDSAGNILAQLVSGRQSNESSTGGGQHLFTADGREANGKVDEPFLKGGAFDPASTSPFSGRKMLHHLATGWGWECASMRLARAADDLSAELAESADGKTRKMILRPVRNRPTLHLGTMLRFVSWAYLPRLSFSRCELEIDAETHAPIQEKYFRENEEEPFCTIRFEDWLDTPEGKAPGQVIGRVTYKKRGERDPETREYSYTKEVFNFTGRYRVHEAGVLLLDEVVSTFETLDSGSTGRVTGAKVVDATDEALAPLQDALRRLDDTAEFLAQVEKAPRGLKAEVPCRWGETIPVWLNGKYEHVATGVGDEDRQPPYVAYRKNLGIRDVQPELLDGQKLRVTVNVYSTLYFQGYAFDVSVNLFDGGGTVMAEQSASDSTKTMSQPELKPVVFEFSNGIDPKTVASIGVSLKIKRVWGSRYYGSRWMSFTSGRNDDRKIAYLPGARDWGPEQAIGEPSDRRIGGDYKHAWSPLAEDGQEEWLELSYRNRVDAVGVDVYETFNPGAVNKVTCYDVAGKERIAWQGKDPTAADVPLGKGVSKIRFQSPVQTNRVRVYLDSPGVKGWNEIDAVGLVEVAAGGVGEREHWAQDATASSTFADEARPETIAYRYEGPHTELKYDDGYRDWMQSLGGDVWQVVRFTRPKGTPYLDAVRVLASRYGSRSRDRKFYVLDERMNVLLELPRNTKTPDSGMMKWYVFHVPSLEVPETFHVGFRFNSQQRGGVYVGTRQLGHGKSGHSFKYHQGQDLEPLQLNGVAHDWMVRAYLAAKPNEKARKEAEARK